MLKTLIAVALTIIVPVALLSACYAISYIPCVQRMLGLDDDDPLLLRVCAGVAFVSICIILLVTTLFVLLSLFIVFYGLL